MQLNSEDAHWLITVADASLRVTNSKQFFSWIQGEVQYLLPHEIAVCCIAVGGHSKMEYRCFSSTPSFSHVHFQALTAPGVGLVARMMQRARDQGDAFLVGQEFTMGDCDKTWVGELEKFDLCNVAAHGLTGANGKLKSYFCFFRLRDHLDIRMEYLLNILLPILDAALCRSLADDLKNAIKRPTVVKKPLLHKRQIQILLLVKTGMTNEMIAKKLNLSTWTVKSHMQNIMKTLNAQSRGQAVIEAINMGLINSG